MPAWRPDARCSGPGGGKGHIDAGKFCGGNGIEPLQDGETTGRNHEYGIFAEGLQSDTVDNGQPAAGAGAVSRMDEFFFGQVEYRCLIFANGALLHCKF